jgi:aspartate aminotransferase
LYTDAELNILKDICVKHDLFLFSDEAYREFCYTDAPYKSALTLDGMQERVVVIDTISKRYSACGARIGSFITKNKDLYNVAMKFAQARLSPPSFGQIAGEAATLLPTNYFQSVKAEYLLRRDTLVNRLNQMEGVFCPMPGGAFYAMAKLPIDDSDKFCQWLLESFSYNGNTIMMAPATGFYATPGKGKQEVRMAYVLNVQAINDAMDCLQQALIQYPGKL